MKEMTRENAIELRPKSYKLEEIVNELLEYKKQGKSVVYKINGEHSLYSCDVTMDSAFLEIKGKTKKEYDEYRKELEAKYEEEKLEEELKLESKTLEWKEKGKLFVYPEKEEAWEEHVKASIERLYKGKELDSVLAVMEKLESGATIEEVKEVLVKETGSSAIAQAEVRDTILKFSKRGPEFYEKTADPAELSDEEKERIENIRNENNMFEEKNEIETLLSEKQQLTSELYEVEQEIEGLREKETNLKERDSNEIEEK